MRNTLNDKLGKISCHRNMARAYKFTFSEKELEEAEARVLKEFFENNPLAYEVASGREQYEERIEPILEKYGTYWRKIWVPKRDEAFNVETRYVISSMNQAGAAYVNPELFTTDGRMPHLYTSTGFTLFVGALLGVVAAMIVGKLPVDYGYLNAYTYAAWKSSPAVALGFPYAVTKPFDNQSMNSHLTDLKRAAKETDAFLLEHYIRL